MKVNIKILGAGCAKCKSLEKMTNEVVQENKIEAEVSKVEDIIEIMNYGGLGTPGFVINEKLIFSGSLPSKDEIKKIIKENIHG